jgi:hypothetical protein
MEEKVSKEDVMNQFHIALKNLMEIYNKIEPAANTTTKNNLFISLDKLAKSYGIIQGTRDPELK